MKHRQAEHASFAPQLFELIQEQKRINQGIINQLEAINSAPPLSNEIRYLKVLLSSSSIHITNSLTEAAQQLSDPNK